MKSQAREIALQILFQSEFTSRISLDDFLGLFEENTPKDSLNYAEEILQGVKAKQKEIDGLIQANSAHWSIQRMSIIDRNILRLCCYELKFSASPVKPAIAINEAVELAKKYSSTESASFVNGILDAISRMVSA